MELLILLLLIMVNGVFAMSEIAIVSARKTRLQSLAEDGNKRALVALNLSENPNRFLSTVQIGITLIGILSGAFGGAAIAGDFKGQLNKIEFLQPYSDVLSVGLVVLLTTYLSLVVGELVPKRLGLQNPERIATIVAQPMHQLSRLTGPVVSLLTYSTSGLLRLLGAQESDRPEITEDDVTAMLLQGAEEGVFERTEHKMVVGVLSLDDVTVGEIMTPRTEIQWLDLEDSLERNLEEIKASEYTRFPVAQGQLDHIIGVLSIKDLLDRKMANQEIDFKALARPPLYVPETQVLAQTLEAFKRTGEALALVIDEHGGIDGLVTITDILEEIVGDVGQADPQIIKRSEDSWLMDGLLSVNELEEVLDLDEETFDDDDFQTLGGFVMQNLGRVPMSTDKFEWGGFQFEVMDMDGRRVDKVLVTKLPTPTPPEAN